MGPTAASGPSLAAWGAPSPLVGERQADVAVLGAGLAGLAVGLELARPDRRVALLDQASVGASASGADLGHVGVGLPMPYTRAQALHGAEGARHLWEWHRESRDRLHSLLPELGEDCGYRSRGGFLVAENREQAGELADSEDALRDDGFSGEFLDHYLLEARFDVRGFAGAYWSADDAEVDALALLRRLAAAFVRRGGLLFEASPVQALEVDERGVRAVTPHGRLLAPVAVMALGSGALALDPRLAREAERTPVHRLSFPPGTSGRLPSPARSADGLRAWRLAAELRLARFSSAAGDPATETDPFEALEAWSAPRLGLSAPAQGRWSGALLGTPRGLPLLGPLDGGPLLLAAGLGSLGQAWAFVAARWIAEEVAGRPAVPEPFRPGRGRAAGAGR